jgi:hypothetical protein
MDMHQIYWQRIQEIHCLQEFKLLNLDKESITLVVKTIKIVTHHYRCQHKLKEMGLVLNKT